MRKPKEKERSLFSIVSKQKTTNFKKKAKEPRKGYYQRKSAKAKEKQINLHGRPVQFEPLDYETIPEGQLILGCVMEIHKYEMILSLPNRLCGVLPITNISDSYRKLLLRLAEGSDIAEPIHSLNELYKVGDMLITTVKTVKSSATERLKIVLSILPEDVNSELRPISLSEGTLLQASVESVEENGFIMNTGIKNVRAAFLPFRNGPSGVVGVGSVFICAVTSILNDRSSEEINIRLSAEQKHLTEKVTLTADTFSSSISPGTLISAQVRKFHSSGIELSIGYSVGFVNNDHLANYEDSRNNYIEGQDVVATVLYITPFTSVFYCSFNEVICQKRIHAMANDIKIGDIVEDAVVSRCVPQGVHLLLPKQRHGFCPLSKLRSHTLKPEDLPKLFKDGSTHTCRIFGINYMDQTYIVALKKSIINEEVFGQSSVEVGMKISGKVLNFVNGGMMISLSETVKGFVSSVHMTDSNMKDPELKYSPGVMVNARVLKNEIGENPVLTLKTELVKMKLPIIKECSESNVGIESKACIFKVSQYGLAVEFFGGAKAFIPRKNIPVSLEENLANVFKVGSIVTCTITHFDEENLKMTAALSQSSKFPGFIKLRDVVNGKVVDVGDVIIFISIDKTSSVGLIPWYHLSDDVEVSRGLFSIVKKGDRIVNALVFNKTGSDNFLSLRPSLFQAAKSDDSKKDTISQKEIIPSVVTEVQNKMMKVETYKRISAKSDSIIVKGFVPNLAGNVRDSRVPLPLAGFHVGQTLFVQCTALKEECILKYDLRSVMKNKEQSSFQYLYNALVTKSHYLNALKRMDGMSPFSKVVVGKKYEGKVVFVCKIGALVNIPSLSLDGVVQVKHFKTKLSRDEVVEVRVLSINCEEKCLELSAKTSNNFYSVKENHKIKVGEKHQCEVLLAKRDFILGWIPSRNGQVIYLPAKRHWNDFRGRTPFYEVGKLYEVKIKYVRNELILADLIDHNVHSSKPLQIITETPYLEVKESVPSSTMEPLTLSLDRLTKIDLGKRARQKIKKVLQVYDLKRKFELGKNDETKFEVLKKETFGAFNEEFYWDCKLRERKNRKKMKKLAPKRKMKGEVKPKKKRSKHIENDTLSKKENVGFKKKNRPSKSEMISKQDDIESKDSKKETKMTSKCEKRKATESTSVDVIASKRKKLASKRSDNALN